MNITNLSSANWVFFLLNELNLIDEKLILKTFCSYSQMADALGIEMSQVEDYVLGDEKVMQFEL